MFNYSMTNPMMNGYSQYGSGGNAYIDMRAKYGYPYVTHSYPPTPMTEEKRDKHTTVERNRLRNFLRQLF